MVGISSDDDAEAYINSVEYHLKHCQDTEINLLILQAGIYFLSQIPIALTFTIVPENKFQIKTQFEMRNQLIQKELENPGTITKLVPEDQKEYCQRELTRLKEYIANKHPQDCIPLGPFIARVASRSIAPLGGVKALDKPYMYKIYPQVNEEAQLTEHIKNDPHAPMNMKNCYKALNKDEIKHAIENDTYNQDILDTLFLYSQAKVDFQIKNPKEYLDHIQEKTKDTPNIFTAEYRKTPLNLTQAEKISLMKEKNPKNGEKQKQ
jgi:hypothetical protein